ncbi:hypothetical protein [Aurantimonas sp. VKM B-3413]|uniref:hypothetical protein n=1 Tax=Aurantimonas sp. VKM B-3413 TaxID=2779401 RepID=UPI001E332281|nr:hypothetical protein [Aurantimonas sp. VKM B-3413]MCB8838789.1 hypothetical protein [Aurantimonas sp. VKM B-3413]
MRNRLKSVGAGMTRLSRRLAMEITVSAIVMVGLQASGGAASLAHWFSGGAKTAEAPARPAAEPHAAPAAGRGGRVDLQPETIAVADPLPAADDRKRLAHRPTGPDAEADGTANRSQGVSAREAGSSVPGEPTGGAGQARSPDMTVPAGVVLFTDCLKACESHDPLLADGATSQEPMVAAPVVSGPRRELEHELSPAPVRLAGLKPEPAAVEPSPTSSGQEAETGGGPTGWLPSGLGIGQDIDAIGSGVGSAVRGVGSLVASVTPW